MITFNSSSSTTPPEVPKKDLSIKLTPGDLTVSDSHWGADHASEVESVLKSVIDVFAEFNVIVEDPVNVSYRSHPRTPVTLYRRGRNNEHLILVTVRERKWNQLVYQFAHEFFHVYTDHAHVKGDHRFRWVEEAFCIATSIYMLRQMGWKWLKNDATPARQKYASLFTSYANQCVRIYSETMQSTTFSEWFREHAYQLEAEPNNYHLTRVVALELLEIIECQPELLEAAYPINRIAWQTESLDQYMEKWNAVVDDQHMPAVARVKSLFEIG